MAAGCIPIVGYNMGAGKRARSEAEPAGYERPLVKAPEAHASPKRKPRRKQGSPPKGQHNDVSKLENSIRQAQSPPFAGPQDAARLHPQSHSRSRVPRLAAGAQSRRGSGRREKARHTCRAFFISCRGTAGNGGESLPAQKICCPESGNACDFFRTFRHGSPHGRRQAPETGRPAGFRAHISGGAAKCEKKARPPSEKFGKNCTEREKSVDSQSFDF